MSTPRYFRADLERKLDGLVELALDTNYTWSHAADEIWKQMDAEFWSQTRNPWLVLQTISRTRLEELAETPSFRDTLRQIVADHRESLKARRWYQETHEKADKPLCVAYFSMEFGLSEALPIYSGGLGLLAGDHLKASDDLGLPLVGIGILYQNGYFRQALDGDGNQIALYPSSDTSELPVCPVRNGNDEWLRIRLRTPSELWVRVWQAQIGRITLYLLDTNDPANHPVDRCITTGLYGGGPEQRLSQEILLGIGGWRVLRALGIHPDVCHLNEGHAALLVLERARDFMAEHKLDFDTALTVTRAGNLFTTHTPVAAGFDRFDPGLVKKRLGAYAGQLGLSPDAMLDLGRSPAERHTGAAFNMAYLAINGSAAVNAVSRLHGEVSRRIFGPLFPGWPLSEIPVAHVTNGVHTPGWDSKYADDLWTEVCGKDRWLRDPGLVAEEFRQVDDAALWEMRTRNRTKLVKFVRKEYARGLHTCAGMGSGDVQAHSQRLFDPNVLTIGFARRFATYKRPNLLLTDPERLSALLNNPARPVQLVMAGKAHPADGPGQALIKAWYRFMQRENIRDHAIFICDYDMLIAENLVQGVDLWINTPRRPWEACGTSGMKVLVNGGLNLSELDGWWAEAYRPDVGWALNALESEDSDAVQAELLYQLLENDIIPKFYRRDENGLPSEWVAMMRESMTRLTPAFSANRMVREYTDRYYLPLADGYRARAANDGSTGRALHKWMRRLDDLWPEIHLGDPLIDTEDARRRFKLPVYLGELTAEEVEVQLYFEDMSGKQAATFTMVPDHPLAGAVHGYLYVAELPEVEQPGRYTPRVIPRHPHCHVPLETQRILWAR